MESKNTERETHKGGREQTVVDNEYKSPEVTAGLLITE